MIKYYQRYFKLLRAKHDPLIKAELDKMIDAGIREYDQTGTITNLPIEGLRDALIALHIEAGTRWAKYTERSIAKKSTKAYERKAAVDDYTAYIREYLNRNLMNKSVIPISETERKIMLQVIADGVENGLGTKKIAANLKDLKLGTARSRLIVRTELSTAMNVGSMLAAANSNVVVRKIWNSAQNSRTRRMPRDQADHLIMDGISVKYDEWFFVPNKRGIDIMMHPGDKNASAASICNCRCAVSFEPTGEIIQPYNQPSNIYTDIIQSVTNSLSLIGLNLLGDEQ